MNDEWETTPLEKKLGQIYAASPRAGFLVEMESDLQSHAQAHRKPRIINVLAAHRWGLVAGALLVALGVIFALPQGRAWAQELLQFFTQTTSDTQPMTIKDYQPAANAGSLRPAFYTDCGDLPKPHCTVGQIQEKASFKVKALAETPDGMSFTGASGSPYEVFLVYDRNDATGSLILDENNGEGQPPLMQIGASAVVQSVPVGETSGEYVSGAWQSSGDNQTWTSQSAVQRLCWNSDGIGYCLFWIDLTGRSEGKMDAAKLTILADGLTEYPSTTTAVVGSSKHLMNVGEAQKLVEFSIAEPAWIPEKYAFRFANVSNGSACLLYDNQEHTGAFTLYVAETAGANLPTQVAVDPSVQLGQQLTPTSIAVRGADGGTGAYIPMGGPQISPVCDTAGRGPASQALFFIAKGVTYGIYAPADDIVTQADLIRIAESIQ
jgi:hypothetical protein